MEYSTQVSRRTSYFIEYAVFREQNIKALEPLVCVGYIEHHNVDVKKPYYVASYYGGDTKTNKRLSTKAFVEREDAINYVFNGEEKQK